MTDADQEALTELIEAHPRYAEDFTPSPKVRGKLRFRVGTTGYWPDIARGTSFDRPKWHYQPEATLTIGRVKPPEPPGRLPHRSDLQTANLHIKQALSLCGRTMRDTEQPIADRALAMTWIAHLVGDSHQPCHAGSLYAENVFDGPAGDRGGNEIKLAFGRNLHAVWDGLLGRRFDENRVRREVYEIGSDRALFADAKKRSEAKGGMTPEVWLEESREFAQQVVYTNEVLSPVRAVAEGRADTLPKITLSSEYLQTAGAVARVRVAHAGYRLAAVWSRCLGGSGEIEEPDFDFGEEFKAQAVRSEPRPAPAPKPAAPIVRPKIKVWVTDTGEKYHREHCRYCNKSGRAIDLAAVRGHMEPCKVCNPPR